MAAVEDTRTISQRFFDVRVHQRKQRNNDHTNNHTESASPPHQKSVAETMGADLRSFARAVQETNFGPGDVLATFLCSATAHVGQFEAPEAGPNDETVDETHKPSTPSVPHSQQGFGASYSNLEHFTGESMCSTPTHAFAFAFARQRAFIGRLQRTLCLGKSQRACWFCNN